MKNRIRADLDKSATRLLLAGAVFQTGTAVVPSLSRPAHVTLASID
ncbi:hypothetical protein [Paraburkholderia ginsengiterrae]|nr:hypothetical protein [Paraburkholderia ginsengiterrae]